MIVEAGGNNNIDLDDWMDPTGTTRPNRSSPQFEDLGAIMVVSYNLQSV